MKNDSLVYVPLFLADMAQISRWYSFEQQGAYLQLRCAAFECNGEIPDNLVERLTGAKTPHEIQILRQVLSEHFMPKENPAGLFWVDLEITQQVIKLKKQRDRSRENGTKGGRPKNPEHNPERKQPISISISKTKSKIISNLSVGNDVIGYDILYFLKDDDLIRFRDELPGWDKYTLAKTFNDGIASGKLKRPNHPAGAFISWAKSYTKGQRP